MDSRQAGLPFSRPQSQQTLRDPRFASISSSPYASQPNTPRPDTLHKHDPFLRRRNDLDNPHRGTSLAPTPRQYGLPSTSNYASNHTMAASDTTSGGSQVRRNSQGSGALFGAARMDRFGSQSSEGAGKSWQHSFLYAWKVAVLQARSPTVEARVWLIRHAFQGGRTGRFTTSYPQPHPLANPFSLFTEPRNPFPPTS